MTKKRSSEIFGAKMEIFSEKTSSWSAKNFSVPPNSTPGFRHCCHSVGRNPSTVLGSHPGNFLPTGSAWWSAAGLEGQPALSHLLVPSAPHSSYLVSACYL